MEHIGGWMWGLLIVLVILYEGWATFSNHQTMSEWVWWYRFHHVWFAYLFVGLLGLLVWHLFFSGR